MMMTETHDPGSTPSAMGASARPTPPPWQPIETAPKGYDGQRFHYVLFRGTSRGRSFAGYAYVSGYIGHDRQPVHSYSYKLDITEWTHLPGESRS